MASTATFDGDLQVRGSVACTSLISGSASITDAMIAAAGGGNFISPSKLKPRVPLGFWQVDGAVSTGEARVFAAYAGGSIVQVAISLDTVPTSTDTVSVDVLRSTGGGAYATILSAPYVLNNTSTARTVYLATISSPAFVAGDLIKVTYTVTGTSAQDLLVCIHGDVNPA